MNILWIAMLLKYIIQKRGNIKELRDFAKAFWTGEPLGWGVTEPAFHPPPRPAPGPPKPTPANRLQEGPFLTACSEELVLAPNI